MLHRVPCYQRVHGRAEKGAEKVHGCEGCRAGCTDIPFGWGNTVKTSYWDEGPRKSQAPAQAEITRFVKLRAAGLGTQEG